MLSAHQNFIRHAAAVHKRLLIRLIGMLAASIAHRKMRVAQWAAEGFGLCCAELAGLLVRQVVRHRPLGEEGGRVSGSCEGGKGGLRGS